MLLNKAHEKKNEKTNKKNNGEIKNRKERKITKL